MKSTNFMLETSSLPSLIFSDNHPCDNDNRLFRLQAGESIHIRSNIDEHNFLYVLKGKVKIDLPDKSVELCESDVSSLRTQVMPKDDSLVTVTAVANTVLYHVNNKRLDDIVTWVGIAQTLEDEPEKLGILSRVLTIKSLTSLPVESVYELITRMKIQTFAKGDVVIRQGDPAEHFYILKEGTAEVWSTGLYDDEMKRVNILHEGDSFGEDALITGGTRSATVKMQTDGVLLVGDQKDFTDLVANPCIEEVDSDATRVMMNKEDYQLLDVRYEEEHEDTYIDGCKLIPLHELRDRYAELDSDKKYITYCRSGKRSAVAALILKQRKFNVVSMRGGINQWPYDTSSMY